MSEYVAPTLTRERTEDLHLQVDTATSQVGPAGAPLLPFDLRHQRVVEVKEQEKITGMFEDFPPGILLDGLNLRDSVQTKGSTNFVVKSQAWYIPGACLRWEFHLQQGAKGEPIRPHIDSTIKKALKNDSSFDVSSSLLFDSQPNVS
ncbi:hypothetical protein DPMN_099022 [Dreissena polymorpha]|uniref:Uncharacterized protein n=1 Tax=Dreissena polymorpha TaxID=45954 RepID=A0A9D4LEQ8_DREPO|nr:hypothetical protein DPMN_099022 [Dreissena polymorpha]